MERSKKRVAIVGLGPSSRDYVSWCDHKGGRKELFDEVWVINSYCSILQCDRIFHMDDLRIQEMRAAAGNPKVAGLCRALKDNPGIPVVTSYLHPDYPHLEEFPLEQAIMTFGSLYYNNTVAYAMVFAMLHKDEIESVMLFGCDYTYPDANVAEAGRGCLEYWCGRATQLGIRVQSVPSSTLFDSMYHANGKVNMYGYEDWYFEVKMTGPSSVDLRKVEKPLPSAEQVEKRYGLQVVDLPDGSKAVEHKVRSSVHEARDGDEQNGAEADRGSERGDEKQGLYPDQSSIGSASGFSSGYDAGGSNGSADHATRSSAR